MEYKVKDCLYTEVITAKVSTTLSELLKIFKNFHSSPIIPVLDKEEKLVGIITLEKILKIFLDIPSYIEDFMSHSITFEHIEEKDISNIEIPEAAGELFIAEDIMDTKFLTIEEEASVSEARKVMKLNKIHTLPVVEGEKFKGLISEFDIILGILKKKGIIS